MWLLLLVGLYLLLLLLVWVFQRRLIYFPDSRSVVRPQGEVWHQLRDVTLQTEDGVELQAWYWPGSKPGTVLFFHGNAGNRAGRAWFIRGLHDLGYGVLLPDYRGYGGSGGEPSETGFYKDAASCLAWLRENVAGSVVYLGSSIGSGVACELARRAPPQGLVLQSGFSSLIDVASSAYPFLPVGWLLRDRYDNMAKIDEAACPLLIIHGAADQIAPLRFARDLYERARQPKEWIEIPTAGHNDLVDAAGPRYWSALQQFLDAHLSD